MQLRTILISTGILTLATSLTLGGLTVPKPSTGLEQRTVDVNHTLAWKLDTQIPPGEFITPNTGLDLTGITRQDGGPHIDRVTGDLVMCCDMEDQWWACYDSAKDKFMPDGRPYRLIKGPVTVEDGKKTRVVIPNRIHPLYSKKGVAVYYRCKVGILIKNTGLALSETFILRIP
ncbi:hypothetical protein BC827DRAFT_1225517 [Russula dissimulans]|nr:hypothetical protein BC827DRAFT_1225517 [Russula dissimulans]